MFSASGFGIWSTIKPDVVEFGGNYSVNNQTEPVSLSFPVEVCPPLVRATRFPPSPEWDRDLIGTSFAAPKVAHIAAALQSLFPEDSAQTCRALIAQSARWPSWAQHLSEDKLIAVLRTLGFGVPSLERATQNDEFRVTLKTSGRQTVRAREALVYEVAVPDSLRAPGLNSRILIEVTLAYAARPRRTRRNLRGYLSTWVDWKSSRLGESAQSFVNRILHDQQDVEADGEGSIPWVIGERIDNGYLPGIRRNAGTLQKDWAVVSAYQLPSSFCVAVVGHPGWDKDPNASATYSLAVSFESLERDVSIYEPIRIQQEIAVDAYVGAGGA
ncbi:S8 family serine peptidase [Archangium primigenium]|uniref:S8 family serine peptidase n=1 Tax=[Archangium] primigenium TaxID=2792470 RepID=UPI001957AE83|nr:S8 family serine peptidase [Archangium primigenium]MBM7112122.1 S8 family serine peptidase [Archangium primigenium]